MASFRASFYAYHLTEGGKRERSPKRTWVQDIEATDYPSAITQVGDIAEKEEDENTKVDFFVAPVESKPSVSTH